MSTTSMPFKVTSTVMASSISRTIRPCRRSSASVRLTLDNCTFTGNSVNYSGGGMHNYYDSNPTLTNTTVFGNTPGQIDGDWTDNDGNTVEDECLEDCPADFNGNGIVDGCVREDVSLMTRGGLLSAVSPPRNFERRLPNQTCCR